MALGKRLVLPEAQIAAGEAAAENAAGEAVPVWAQQINETTVAQIQQALADAKSAAGGADLTIEQTAAAVKAVLERAAKIRSAIIAADQIMRARANAQSSIVAQDAEVTAKIWVTAGDELVCPLCRNLGGSMVGAKGQFMTDGGAVSGPPLHVMCRCWLAYVRGTEKIPSEAPD